MLKLSLAHRVNYLGGPQAKGGGGSILWSFKNINIFSKPKAHWQAGRTVSLLPNCRGVRRGRLCPRTNFLRFKKNYIYIDFENLSRRWSDGDEAQNSLSLRWLKKCLWLSTQPNLSVIHSLNTYSASFFTWRLTITSSGSWSLLATFFCTRSHGP